MFENPRRGRQARNLTTNVPKILDLKSSSEQIFSRKLSLGAPVYIVGRTEEARKERVVTPIPIAEIGIGATTTVNWLCHVRQFSILFTISSFHFLSS